jgi:hypothetical protein
LADPVQNRSLFQAKTIFFEKFREKKQKKLIFFVRPPLHYFGGMLDLTYNIGGQDDAAAVGWGGFL